MQQAWQHQKKLYSHPFGIRKPTMFPSFFILRDEKIYLQGFSYSKSISNFEPFLQKIYSSINFMFLKRDHLFSSTQYFVHTTHYFESFAPKRKCKFRFFCGYVIYLQFLDFFYTSSQIKYVSALKQQGAIRLHQFFLPFLLLQCLLPMSTHMAKSNFPPQGLYPGDPIPVPKEF